MISKSSTSLFKTLTASNTIDASALSAALNVEAQEASEPWYIQLLLCLGAVLAGIPILFPLYLALAGEPAALAVSAALVGLGAWLYRFQGGKRAITLTLSLALVLVGKCMAIAALLSSVGGFQDAALASAAVTVLAYFLYPLAVDRLLWTLGSWLFLVFAFTERDPLLITSSFMITLALTWICYLPSLSWRALRPFAQAMHLSLPGLLIWSRINNLQDFDLVATYTLGLATLVFAALLFRQSEHKDPIALALVAAFACGLSLLHADFALLALFYLSHGLLRRDFALCVLGAIVLPCGLADYYYNLDMSLIYKAQVLIANGLVCLALYAYLKFKEARA